MADSVPLQEHENAQNIYPRPLTVTIFCESFSDCTDPDWFAVSMNEGIYN